MPRKPKRTKFYPVPTDDPSFKALQDKWYAKLAKDGFVDAEDTNNKHQPLRDWTGVSSLITPEGTRDLVDVIDMVAHQPAEGPIVSNFPDPIFKQEEDFTANPDFDRVCQDICKHGNSVLTPTMVASIWKDYCNGMPHRDIGKHHDISNFTVWNTIRKVSEWMNLVASATPTGQEDGRDDDSD